MILEAVSSLVQYGVGIELVVVEAFLEGCACVSANPIFLEPFFAEPAGGWRRLEARCGVRKA
jgi:hypothetical protein